MSAPHVGLGAFELGIEKLFDKIPTKVFAKETYGLGSDDKPSRRQSQSQNQKSRSGGAAGSAEDSDQESYKQEPDSQPRRRASQDQGYYDQGYRGDSTRRDQDLNTQIARRKSVGGRHSGFHLDGPPDSSRGRTENALWTQREREESPMQQDPYYPPPPGQNYHRYNPADYQPQGYNGGANNGYAAVRSQPDPYGRPASAGANNRYDDRRYSDERRESRNDKRERRRKSRRSPSRSRSRSSSVGIKSKFDSSKEGLTTGAIGALAGGLIANEVGKSPLATIAGLVIGGLGANAWEARDQKKKTERERSRSRHRPEKSSSNRARSEGRDRDRRRSSAYQGGSGDYDGYNDRNGGGPNAAYNERYAPKSIREYDERDGGGGYESYGSGSEEEERARERRRRRKRDKEKKRDNKPETWGDILKG